MNHSSSPPSKRHTALLAVALFAITLLIFLQATRFEFLEYDDGRIVYQNDFVLRGLHPDTALQAFRQFHFGLYMPLTTLTHLLDVSLYGSRAGGHHLTSVLLHALNASLLLLALRALTGRLWLSFFAAALFAIHPLRIESVVWIASRKDLVSGCFFMLCLLAYASYARRPARWRYLIVTFAYTDALLGKPTVIPAPLLLLVLDWWPLNRLQRSTLPRLLLEKLPLLVIAGAATALTMIAENHLETLTGLDGYPLLGRVENALLSYARYFGHVFYPLGLSIHYPQIINGISGIWIAAAALLLFLLTALALVLARQRFLLAGWLWFLLLLAPVIGLVQFGSASMADRFTYLPQIGLNLAVVWGGFELATRLRLKPAVLAAFGALVLLLLACITLSETRHWRDTRSVFTRALAVTGQNAVASLNLGKLAFDEGHLDQALQLFAEASALEPRNPETHYNLGCALLEAGRFPEAVSALETALQFRPRDASAHMNLGIAYLNLRQQEPALAHLAEAVRLVPDHASARANYGVALLRAGRSQEAAQELREALRLDPNNAAAQANLKLVLDATPM